MRAERRFIVTLIVVLILGLIAASPSTRPTPVDPLARLTSAVAGKAVNQSVVLVLRPDASSSAAESPLAVAAIRDLVLAKLTDAQVKIATSVDADALLRDSASAGAPTVPVASAVLAAAKTDLILYGSIYRSGEVHKIGFSLLNTHKQIMQMPVVLPTKSITVGGDDLEKALTDIADEVEPVVGKMTDSLLSENIKTVLLTVRSDSAGSSATAGFEMALFDSISHQLKENHLTVQAMIQSIGRGPLKPSALAEMKDVPADSALAVATYTRRPGGTLIKMSIVSTRAQLATASLGLDSWDVGTLPALPVYNLRVLKYADAQQGKKIGNGECWTLAAEALKTAGAEPADGYTFGRKLATGEPILAGDIFQFTSARFEGHSNGGTWWIEMGSPNHTAVVRRVLGPTKYELLEQNPGPVKTATIDFKDLKSGVWEAWRPLAR